MFAKNRFNYNDIDRFLLRSFSGICIYKLCISIKSVNPLEPTTAIAFGCVGEYLDYQHYFCVS